MATGRVEVLRRRDSYKYSEREFEYYRTEGFRGQVSHGRGDGVKRRNGFHSSSDGCDSGVSGRRSNDSKPKNGSHLSSDVWNSRGSVPMSNPSEPMVRVCKTRKSENVVQLPPKKKRKFSPIIWNMDDREERVSSKNRVVPVVPLPLPPSRPTVARLSAEVPDAVSDGGVSKSPISVVESQRAEVSQVKPSAGDGLAVEVSQVEPYVADGLVVEVSRVEGPVDLSTQLHSEQFVVDEKAQKNMEDKEASNEGSVPLSRWAYDSDSPRDLDDDVCSLPESGEIRREGSGGSRTRSSSSDEEGSFVRHGSGDEYYGEELCDGDMDIDKHGGDAGVDQLCSDSEDDAVLPRIEEPEVPKQGCINMLQGCRSVFEFERIRKINEGTYGVVYKARDKMTEEIVALKKVKMDVDNQDGFPMSALREINILMSFNHPSVVGVKEVVMDDADGVYMVMEYMEYDLKGLVELMKQPFSIGEVKYLMLQLLKGVEYLHDNWVLHRDLKSSNLLLNKEGELKICDFGLSRQYGTPLKPYTPLVVTLWYRAPEVLLGTEKYSTAIDMWSVGCIMAEFLAKKPLFDGKTEAQQLDKIFRILGTPDAKSGLSKLPGFKANFVKQPYNLLRKKFPAASFTGSCPVLSESGFDLLKRLLSYNPAERITAKDALKHHWFHECPEPRYDFKPVAREDVVPKPISWQREKKLQQ